MFHSSRLQAILYLDNLGILAALHMWVENLQRFYAMFTKFNVFLLSSRFYDLFFYNFYFRFLPL